MSISYSISIMLFVYFSIKFIASLVEGNSLLKTITTNLFRITTINILTYFFNISINIKMSIRSVNKFINLIKSFQITSIFRIILININKLKRNPIEILNFRSNMFKLIVFIRSNNSTKRSVHTSELKFSRTHIIKINNTPKGSIRCSLRRI